MPEPLRILLIEDSDDDAQLIRYELDKSGKKISCMERVASEDEMKQALDLDPWDVVLCDYFLPGFGGFRALKVLKQSKPDIPFILLSGTVDDEMAADAMKAGASDYINKNNLSRLMPAIERGLRESRVRQQSQETKQKLLLAEEKLSLSEQRLRLHREQSPLGVIEWNLNFEVVDWNPAAEKIFGYGKEEVLGKRTPKLIISKNASEELANVWKDIISGKGKIHHVGENLTKDGNTVLCEWNDTPLIDDNGTVIGYSSTVEDITVKRQQEAALQQAQKMEAVGQLTGGIAHDFNNLLSIISGNLRFLREDIGETSEDIDELFEDAISAVDDGAELTQRLLGFSRTKVLHLEYTNVNDIIEKSVRFLSRTLVENTDLETVLPDATLFINVDPSQLENALLNLCINARDAMPEGGTITISAERYHHGSDAADDYSVSLSEGDYVKISVTDTGTGIDPEDMQYVYEPFYTTKDMGKGSGLGLSMVFGFTQQSQGACHIDSTPGEGTTVSMVFPEVVEQRDMDQTPEDAEELPAHDSKVILVVEDEARVRRVALRDLKKLGYQTLEAENADMARTIIESGEHIDLLFSDILMPGEMDGHMLAVWTQEHYPQIKIVLTSGYSKGKTEMKREDKHLFPLLRKPYTSKNLARQIKTSLQA